MLTWASGQLFVLEGSIVLPANDDRDTLRGSCPCKIGNYLVVAVVTPGIIPQIVIVDEVIAFSEFNYFSEMVDVLDYIMQISSPALPIHDYSSQSLCRLQERQG